MELIDKNGIRQVCDHCRRVRGVKFKRNSSVCNDCRSAAWAEEMAYRCEMNRQCGSEFYKLARFKRSAEA